MVGKSSHWQKYQLITQRILRHNFKLKVGERVLIILSEDANAFAINRLFFSAALELKARPTLLVQTARGQSDQAEPAVIAAVLSEPEVILNFRRGYFGYDAKALKNPYVAGKHRFNSPVQYLSNGKKVTRAAWGSSLPLHLFFDLLDIDYSELKKEIRRLANSMRRGREVHATSPAGTDIRFSIWGRQVFDGDDGDFSKPGGHNLPCGEVFVSPVLGSANGRVVLDGCISVDTQTMLIKKPLIVDFINGYAVKIQGGKEAILLQEALKRSERRAQKMGDTKKAKDAYHLGEFGLGCNPKARVSQYLIEAEKAIGTCHFAIGSNYDQDDHLPFNHYDGVVKNPTVLVDGKAIRLNSI